MEMSGDQAKEVLERLDSLQDLVQKTYAAISGDPSIGHRGLAERVERLELGQAAEANARNESLKRAHERIDRQERRWYVLIGAVFGAGLTGGGVGAALVSFWGGA
ncbi:MAG TPA: hypothetical protein VF377_10445 [Acidimicrobiia bacterium]